MDITWLIDSAMPLVRHVPPETAHRMAIRALRLGLCHSRTAPDPILRTQVLGLDFASPVGLAAGFDKNGEAVRAVLDLGAGSTEIGTVTPRPQAGNPMPRLFRLPEARALINRNGFSNDGLEVVAERIAAVRAEGGLSGPLGINLGINKDCAEPMADYAAGLRRFARMADYLVINVSSPNTPGLRDLQARDLLLDLARGTRQALDDVAADSLPPLLFKISPDLDDSEINDIAEVATEARIDGLIVTNTTTSRSADLTGAHLEEAGGLSGPPLMALSTEVLRKVWRATGGSVPLIGCGGVSSGDDAFAKITAGASLVQLYTAVAFQGPGALRRIRDELAARLRAEGFDSVGAAVGAEHRSPRAAAA